MTFPTAAGDVGQVTDVRYGDDGVRRPRRLRSLRPWHIASAMRPSSGGNGAPGPTFTVDVPGLARDDHHRFEQPPGDHRREHRRQWRRRRQRRRRSAAPPRRAESPAPAATSPSTITRPSSPAASAATAFSPSRWPAAAARAGLATSAARAAAAAAPRRAATPASIITRRQHLDHQHQCDRHPRPEPRRQFRRRRQQLWRRRRFRLRQRRRQRRLGLCRKCRDDQHDRPVYAYGVQAQSIGGNGGSSGNSAGIVAFGGSGGGAGTGGSASIKLDSTSSITTTGNYAHGAFAQSIGGGGGSTGWTGSADGVVRRRRRVGRHRRRRSASIADDGAYIHTIGHRRLRHLRRIGRRLTAAPRAAPAACSRSAAAGGTGNNGGTVDRHQRRDDPDRGTGRARRVRPVGRRRRRQCQYLGRHGLARRLGLGGRHGRRGSASR